MTAPRTDPPTEFAWLAERGQSMKQVPTVWWTGDPDDSEYGWTTDATRAMRFSTRESATAYIEARSPIPGNRDRWATAVEHGFIGRTDPESTVPVEPPAFDAVAIVAGALKGTYHAEFPKAEDDDWRADAEFVLARFQESGATLDAARASQPITATALSEALRDGIEAFRLTREYVDPTGELLPAIEGWSWFDWCQKAERLLAALPVREDEPTGIDVAMVAGLIEDAEQDRALVREWDERPIDVERLGRAIASAFASHAEAAPRGMPTVKFDPIEGRKFTARVAAAYDEASHVR